MLVFYHHLPIRVNPPDAPSQPRALNGSSTPRIRSSSGAPTRGPRRSYHRRIEPQCNPGRDRELWSQYRSTPTARPKRAAWAIPPYLWRNSVFEVSVLASLTLAMAMLGALYYVPIFSQGVMGLFVVNSGFLLIPLDIGIIEVSAANGFLISKTGRFTP